MRWRLFIYRISNYLQKLSSFRFCFLSFWWNWNLFVYLRESYAASNLFINTYCLKTPPRPPDPPTTNQSMNNRTNLLFVHPPTDHQTSFHRNKNKSNQRKLQIENCLHWCNRHQSHQKHIDHVLTHSGREIKNKYQLVVTT